MQIGQIHTKLCVCRFWAKMYRHLSHIRIHRLATVTYKKQRNLFSSSGGSAWVYAHVRECAPSGARLRADSASVQLHRIRSAHVSDRTVHSHGCMSERIVRLHGCARVRVTRVSKRTVRPQGCASNSCPSGPSGLCIRAARVWADCAYVRAGAVNWNQLNFFEEQVS